MELLIEIILVAGPLILSILLSTRKNISRRLKTTVWVICLFICGVGIYKIVPERIAKKEESLKEQYKVYLLEREELRESGHPQDYINGLLDNPLTSHYLKEGKKYETKFKYNKAIEEYRKCLNIPTITTSNKVAVNILIGNCYFNLSELYEAEKHYIEARIISRKVNIENERLMGESVALGNIGLIYRNLGKPEEALKYLNNALEIDRKIGYEQGIANQLGNIGLIYSDLGKPEEALKYFNDALEIHRKIGYEQGIANQLGNIGLIYSGLGKLEEALKYHNDALEIDRKIGYEQGIASDLGNIGVIYRNLGKPEEALKYLNESLVIFKRVGAQREIGIAENNISIIEQEILKDKLK